MSEYRGGNKDDENVLSFKGKKKPDARKKIVPSPIFNKDREQFNTILEGLRHNNGQICKIYIDIAGDKAITSIHSVTPLYYENGQSPSLEIRYNRRPVVPGESDKTYRHYFWGNVSGCDDARNNGERLCGRLDELKFFTRQGLFIPTNSGAMLAAVRAYTQGTGLQPAIFWCEGEKTRLAVNDRLSSEYANSKLSEKKLIAITAATLSGKSGVRNTNYAIRPPASAQFESTIPGVNDEYLDLKRCINYVIRDADVSGIEESGILCERLIYEYEVPSKQVILVEPPLNKMPQGWDDADPLPDLWTEERRIDQILNSPCYDFRWVYAAKAVIDQEDLRNKIRAIKEAGVSYNFDYAMNCIIKNGDAHSAFPEGEILDVALRALKVMGHKPIEDNLKLAEWRKARLAIAYDDRRDTIYEEALAACERGQPLMNETNRPEMLFVNTFGMPNTKYNRLLGHHIMHDHLSLMMKAAFGKNSFTPQLLLFLVGRANFGKSTFVKVLSGASPTTSPSDSPRYSDKFKFSDFKENANLGLRKYNKLVGRTAMEIAEITAEDITDSVAEEFKHFVNEGTIQARGIGKEDDFSYNIRCSRIGTSNDEEVITKAMGLRRWAAMNFNLSTWPERNTLEASLQQGKPTEHEAAILAGRNPGLDWLHENLPAMLAHVYYGPDFDKWTGEVRPELARLLQNVQSDHLSSENWEDIVEIDFSSVPEKAGISIEQLALYTADLAMKDKHVTKAAMAKCLTAQKWTRSQRKRTAEEYRKMKKILPRADWRTHVYVWHRVVCDIKEVDRYMIWASGSLGMGKWIEEPSDEKIKRIEESLTEDMPF